MSQQLQVVGLKGKYGEFGAHGVLELQQDASSVYDFMRRIEDQPKWNPGVKLSQIIDRVATNVFHVKQVYRPCKNPRHLTCFRMYAQQITRLDCCSTLQIRG
eukprot:GHRR01018186.1.p1 GENE.GHRR01018186.1~~GHRR01018186.1.p1  ORF type:complete len:102 (-),score=8.82 GHRR01018186.1:169-474(-)